MKTKFTLPRTKEDIEIMTEGFNMNLTKAIELISTAGVKETPDSDTEEDWIDYRNATVNELKSAIVWIQTELDSIDDRIYRNRNIKK